MGNSYGKTEMGGANERFETTCWTEIANAHTLNETRKKETVNELILKYWKPVYSYLRRKGYDNDSTKDMVQGFFYEIVLGRDLIRHADKTKGKFRTFLLTALSRYATDKYRKDTAAIRNPESGLQSLDSVDLSNVLDTQHETNPEQAFHYNWACDILNEVLDKVKDQCEKDEKKPQWKIFYARVIEPILTGVEPAPLKELCCQIGIAKEARASDMIFNTKKMFRTAMRQHLRQFVDTESQVDDELNEIFQILSNKHTR